MQIETTGGCGSKLNKIIDLPKIEHNAKTRIGMGLNQLLPMAFWFFSREHATFIKMRTWDTVAESTPYCKYTNQIFK